MEIFIIHAMIIACLVYSLKQANTLGEYIAAPILVWAFFLLLYVIPYWVMPEEAVAFFVEEGYVKLSFLALLCGIFFQLGFNLDLNKKRIYLEVYPSAYMIKMASFCVIISVLMYFGMVVQIGISTYYGVTHSGGMRAHVSGYVYEMRNVSFGALAILAVYMFKGKISHLNRIVFFYMPLFLLIADAVLMGQRGSFIRIIVFSLVLLGIKILPNVNKKTKRKIVTFSGVVGIGLVCFILILPFIRTLTHLGDASDFDIAKADKASSFTAMERIKRSLFGSDTGNGNEMLFAAALVSARDETGEFDAGLKWLLPVINFIPRSVWGEDKPRWKDFSIDTFVVMVSAGYWLPAPGSAETGVADSYMRFVWLAPLSWLFLGLFGGSLYRKSCVVEDDTTWILYAGYFLGMVYFLTQNFFPLFYSMFFIYVAVYFVRWMTILISGKRCKLIL